MVLLKGNMTTATFSAAFLVITITFPFSYSLLIIFIVFAIILMIVKPYKEFT